MLRSASIGSFILCTLSLIGSGCALDTTNEDFGSSTGALTDPECVVSLHSILEEGTDVVGEVQFRLRPSDDGSGDAVISYDGVFVPREPDFAYSAIGVSIRSRFDDQSPIFYDFAKSETGTPTSQLIELGRVGLLDGTLARTLVDTPTDFRAVVSVVATTGGREAEGLVEPDRGVPESLRDKQRTCF